MKKKHLTTAQDAELKERRSNTIKMRFVLMNTDALLRLILIPWMLFAGIVAAVYAISPATHSFYLFIIWSLACYLGHYIIVGMTRRMSETYLIKLCGADDQTSPQSYDEEEKTSRSIDDPALTKFSFRITNALGIPRRGLGHMLIALSHWLILALYVLNYILYFNSTDIVNAPVNLFVFHLTLTLAGVVMIFKNAAYLIKSRDILALIYGVLDFRHRTAHKGFEAESEDENPEIAIKGSMTTYRFENNKPPVNTCHTCVAHMAKHVAEDIPMVMLENDVKAELVSKLIKLRRRSPKFALALRDLLEHLKHDPEHSSAQAEVDEFIKILRRTDELVEALYLLDENSSHSTK